MEDKTTENNNFVPRKRTALDGKVWWCVWDLSKNTWATTCYCKSKTKKDCSIYIQLWSNRIK